MTQAQMIVAVVAARLATAGVLSPLTPRTFAAPIAVQRYVEQPAGLPGTTSTATATKPAL
jgi:hypothetical protein